LCLCLRQPLPVSTLFPYTTLFRSQAAGGAADAGQAEGGAGAGGDAADGAGAAESDQAEGDQAEAAQEFDGATAYAVCASCHQPGDRKSTRLNSSHVKISYAVFCLK